MLRQACYSYASLKSKKRIKIRDNVKEDGQRQEKEIRRKCDRRYQRNQEVSQNEFLQAQVCMLFQEASNVEEIARQVLDKD